MDQWIIEALFGVGQLVLICFASALVVGLLYVIEKNSSKK
jgi:hypothetical protein